jgi:hypothetical protein
MIRKDAWLPAENGDHPPSHSQGPTTKKMANLSWGIALFCFKPFVFVLYLFCGFLVFSVV